MIVKPEQTAFEAACQIVERLNVQERLAMMKLLSLSLDGPRLYTDADVKVIVAGALDEHRRRATALSAMAKLTGKAN